MGADFLNNLKEALNKGEFNSEISKKVLDIERASYNVQIDPNKMKEFGIVDSNNIDEETKAKIKEEDIKIIKQDIVGSFGRIEWNVSKIIELNNDIMYISEKIDESITLLKESYSETDLIEIEEKLKTIKNNNTKLKELFYGEI